MNRYADLLVTHDWCLDHGLDQTARTLVEHVTYDGLRNLVYRMCSCSRTFVSVRFSSADHKPLSLGGTAVTRRRRSQTRSYLNRRITYEDHYHDGD